MSNNTSRSGGAPASQAPNAALLIDFDNVTLGVRSDLTKELRSLLNSDIIKGKVAVQRAYADWRRYPQYIVPLSESSIDLIFAPAFGTNKKNATDIRLAIDAMELVFTRPEIGTFILLSGDSDFSSMVIKLKEYGKYVIGVGLRESASDLLIQNCDEYYSYSDLAGLSREDDRPSVQRDPWELVVEAVQRMADNNDVMRSDRLKQVMQQIDPTFEERNAGFSRFSRFVLEAASRGLISCDKLDNGQYEVAPVTTAAAPAAEPAARDGRRRSRSRGRTRDDRAAASKPSDAKPAATSETKGRRESGRTRGRRSSRGRAEREEQQKDMTLAQAFTLLSAALQQLEQPAQHESLRLRMATLHGKEDPMLEPGRFARLLRQAHDAEIADVRKVAEGEYEVSETRTEIGMRVQGQEPAAEPEASSQEEADTPARPDASPSRGIARFRRGSRGKLREGMEIPMVGVVDEEPSATPAAESAEDSKAASAESPDKPARKKTSSRRKSTGRKSAASKSASAKSAGSKKSSKKASSKKKSAKKAASRKRTTKPGAKKSGKSATTKSRSRKSSAKRSAGAGSSGSDEPKAKLEPAAG